MVLKGYVGYKLSELFGTTKEEQLKTIDDILEVFKEGKTFSFLVDKRIEKCCTKYVFFEQHFNDEVYMGEAVIGGPYNLNHIFTSSKMPEKNEISKRFIANAIVLCNLLCECDKDKINNFVIDTDNYIKESLKEDLYRIIFKDDVKKYINEYGFMDGSKPGMCYDEKVIIYCIKNGSLKKPDGLSNVKCAAFTFNNGKIQKLLDLLNNT